MNDSDEEYLFWENSGGGCWCDDARPAMLPKVIADARHWLPGNSNNDTTGNGLSPVHGMKGILADADITDQTNKRTYGITRHGCRPFGQQLAVERNHET